LAASILVVTAYTPDFARTAACSIPTMKAWCETFGLQFRAVELSDPPRRRGWLKTPVIRDALSAQTDWVFWVDADAVVLRNDRDIRTACRDDASLLMAWHSAETADMVSDWMRTHPHYNAGVMLIRADDWSRDFFRDVWDAGEIEGQGWTDQARIHEMLGYRDVLGLGPDEPSALRARVAPLDTTWNSIPGAAMMPDPVICHYAGFKHETRDAFMKLAAASAAERAPKPQAARDSHSRGEHLLALAFREQTYGDRFLAADGIRKHGNRIEIDIPFRLRRGVHDITAVFKWSDPETAEGIRVAMDVNGRPVADGRFSCAARPIRGAFVNLARNGTIRLRAEGRGEGAMPDLTFAGAVLQRRDPFWRRRTPLLPGHD
jgi:hypothetical protein